MAVGWTVAATAGANRRTPCIPIPSNRFRCLIYFSPITLLAACRAEAFCSKILCACRFSLTRNSGVPTKWSVSTPKAIPGISAGRDLQRIGVTSEEAKQEARKPIWRD
jgi:hypothetical protein